MAQAETQNSSVEASCVQVFGKVTASVSHEIKNVLAIINENAGLLDDIVLMGGPDQGVPPERVQAATKLIAKQVNRANIIIKNINRFAHSGDTPTSQEQLAEILNLMVALTDRQAAMKTISTTVTCQDGLTFIAPMLVFESFLYLALRHFIDCSPHNGAITISASSANGQLTIGIEGRDLKGDAVEQFNSMETKALVTVLRGQLSGAASGVQLSMPVGEAL